MGDLERFKEERDALLIEHLNRISTWDLERLKHCFESEYKYDIDNRDSLDNILLHLNKILEERSVSNA